MSLDGSVFLDLILVITVTAFVGLVIMWPHLGGHGLHVVAARAGLLVAVNALILLTVATQLNAQYLFYASWRDLLGSTAGPSTALVSRGGRAAQAAGQAVAGAAARVGTQTLPPLPPGGRVHTYTVTGRRSGITGQVFVELPPGYSSRSQAATRYPVLETFGGYPASPGQWIRTMRLGDLIASGVAAGQLRSALIVSPQVEFPRGTDTECVNGGPGRPAVETWVSQDVPTWVAQTFRVAPARSSWATIGLSAGAWCAAMVTMLHPAQYGAAVVMGGYFQPDFGAKYEPFGPGSPAAQRYDLLALARNHPPPVAIWLETSHADSLSYGSSDAMLRAVRPPTSVQAVVLQNAGHRISVWKGELPQVVRWLGANIPGFSPLRG